MRHLQPTAIIFAAVLALTGCPRPRSAELVSISISPENARINRGGSTDFVATGIYADGAVKELTNEVVWQVVDGFVATVDAEVPGRVHGVNTGTTRVRAISGEVSRTLPFTVVGGAVVRLELSPSAPVVPVGLSMQLTVNAVRADDSVEDVTRTAIYSAMGNASAISMRDEDPGVIIGATPGQSELLVSFEGVSVRATITVTDATIRQLTLSPSNPSVPVGTTQRLTATASLSDGTFLDVTEQAQWTSSAPRTAFVSMLAGERGTLTGVAPGVTEVQAKVRGAEAAVPVTVTDATLSRVEVDPTQLTLARGTLATVSAQAIYSDGTRQDVTNQGSWSSSAPDKASVSMAGQVRGVDLGTATLRFEYQGKQGSVAVSVTAAELIALEVSPSPLTLAAGTNAQLTATGRFSDGSSQDLTEATLWTAQDVAIAQVSNGMGQRGFVRGLTAGTTQLVAASGARTARVTVTVSPATLMSLSLAPAMLSLPMGTSADVVATGVFSDGSSQDLTSQVSWTSADPTVAAVDPVTNPGRVSALSLGQATISAQHQGVSAQLIVQVSMATLSRLEVTPSSVTVAAGTTAQLVVTGVFSDSSTQDVTTQVTFSSDDVAIATVSNASGTQGLVRGVSQGATALHVELNGVTVTVPVTVSAATLQSLSVSQTSLSLPVGVSADVSVTGLYSDGSTQDLTSQATWSSSSTAIASVSNSGATRGRVAGVAVGSATVSVSFGGRSATVAVTVTQATLVSLSLTPAIASMPRGTTQAFVATGSYTDGSTRDVSSQVTWSASGAELSVSSTGLATALQLGTADVIAREGAVEARVTITVTQAVLTALGLTPTLPSVPRGVAVPFVATATYSDGTTQNVTTQVTWSSADAAVATISNGTGTEGRAQAIAVGSTLVTATLGAQSAGTTLTVLAAALDSIEVSPSTARIATGTFVTFQATGRYTDGSTQDLSAQVTWSVSDVSKASASNAAPFFGRVSALQPGTLLVTATRQGVNGSATLEIANVTLSSLAISPAAPSAAAGLSQQLTVVGTFSDSSTQDLTGLVTWSSSDVSKVTISNAALSEGLARALAVGTSTITASALGQSGTATFTVTNALLTGLEVSPVSISVARGLTHDFVATGRFSDGSSSDVTAQVTWASSAPGVASISNANGSRGRATAIAQGSSIITASLSGQSAAAVFVVSPAVLTHLQVSPSSASLPRGLTAPFTVTGIFSDSTSQDLTEQVVWSSSSSATATVSNAPGTRGVVQAANVGTTTITATQGSISGTASITVTSAVLAAIQVAPPNPTVPRGLTRQLSATGLFTDGTTQDLTTQASWSSDDVLIATVSNAGGSEGMSQAIDQGVVTITATIGARTGSIQLSVSAAILQVIQVNPVSPSVSAGLTLPLSATGVYSDSSTQDVTSQVTWSSSDTGIATISNASGFEGVVTGGTIGSAVMTASLSGVTGSTTVTVTPSVLQQLQVTPANPSRPRGLEVQFTATGLFSDGSTQDMTSQVTWTSSDVSVVPVSNMSGAEGRAIAQNVGSATITATHGSVSDSTPFTVTAAQLTRVDVTPMAVTLPLGTVRQFVATGRYTDSTSQNLTAQATWSSSSMGVLDISNVTGSEGLATTIAIGQASVTMTFGAFTVVSSVTITQAALASIELNPSAGATPLGFTRQFIAIGHYTDGTSQVLTNQATWSSSDTLKALISNASSSRGLLSTVATGTVTVTAVFNGVTGTTTHTISNASLVSLSLAAASVSVAQGASVSLVATGSYSDGSTQDLTASVTWSSSAAGVAQVSNASGSEGLVTGVSPGSAVVTAQSGSVSQTVNVNVTP